MKKLSLLIGFGLISIAALASSETIQLNFDEVKAGELPAGWKVDATGPGKKLAEWKVTSDASAPTKPNVLTLTKPSDSAFNLCWTNELHFKDGSIEVKIKANTGEEDQGGGLIWRARDGNNYYIARYNPLERNFRLYYVKEGRRIQLDDAKANVKTGEWFIMTISQKGDSITAWLNGQKLLHAKDSTFSEEGGVGFWTKADAATSFDNLAVNS